MAAATDESSANVLFEKLRSPWMDENRFAPEDTSICFRMKQDLCENNSELDNDIIHCTGFDPKNLSFILNSLSVLLMPDPEPNPFVDGPRQRANGMGKIVLRNYHSLTELPLDELAAIFPNISELVVYKCVNLNDISSLFSSFPNLRFLKLEGCHEIKSLDFLSHAPPHGLQLSFLEINDCGLVYCPSWERAIQVLAANLRYLLLVNLPKLTQLPAEIGNLQNLEYLCIHNTSIRHLPQEIGRLEGCAMTLVGDKMICPPIASRMSMKAMRTYFSRKRLRVFKGLVRLAILFGRSRRRAVERIYMPGGIGYKRCREHFLETSCEHARKE
jgi:hypothetical protein